MSSTRRFRLRLLGSPCLAADDGEALTGAACQRHRLALLALLALAPGQAMSRERLMSYLWPERDIQSARGLLKQAVYVLRKALGEEAFTGTRDGLRLDPWAVRVDVVDFEAALGRGEHAAAVALYHGAFLDGFFLSGSAEFEEWTGRERLRLAGAYGKALQALAVAAEERGELGTAVDWWQASAAHDPLDSHIAIRLMYALEACGNRAGALKHAAAHRRLLQDEIGVDADPDLVALVERLRSMPPPAAAEAPYAAVSPPADVKPTRTVRLPAHLPRYAAAALLFAGLLIGTHRLARNGASEQRAVAGAVVTGSGTQNIAAHELFLRGIDPMFGREDSALMDGVAYLRQAVALDSNYAAAWAALARRYSSVANRIAWQERSRYHALAAHAAQRALELDGGLADAHATLGAIRMRFFDAAAAERHLTRALDLDSTSALAWEWLVPLLMWTGRPAEALAGAERAVALAPLSPLSHAALAHALLHNDRCDEALARLDHLAGMQPPLIRAAPLAALCHARQQRWQQAVSVLQPQAARGEPHTLALLGYMHARAGNRDAALAILDDALGRLRRGEGSPWHVAVLHAGLGDTDQAFAWLDWTADRDPHDGVSGLTANLIIMGPLLDELRHDPRFAAVRARLGLQMR